MPLIIIESPNKISKLRKILGSQYKVMATKGHVLDLPPKQLGVDVDSGFEPRYEVIRGRGSAIKEISDEAKKHDVIYLATDPDREGEAIAAHIASRLPQRGKTIHRVRFNAITANAVRAAIDNPQDIDQHLYDAQQARRVTDRLVGYEISPIMWRKGIKGASAGRVQSVALKYVVDRDREIAAFEPEEYWEIDAQMEPGFAARMWGINRNKKIIRTDQVAQGIRQILMDSCQRLKVTEVDKRNKERTTAPPFTTSSLQQAANNILGWGVDRTMKVAQQLFERGVITYHRTDSVAVDASQIGPLRSRIASVHGDRYIGEKPNYFRSKKSSQEAHEAIRPTGDTASLNDEQDRLFRLIQNRFEASQMAPALYEKVTVELESIDTKLPVNFRVHGSRLLFDGFLKVYGAAQDDVILPDLEVGDEISFTDVALDQKFTQPPSRYSDATLVKKMETDGVGRPATYASIINVLKNRKFIVKNGKTFQATELGGLVLDYLTMFFPDFVDPHFTAQMEEQLDEIASGHRNYRDTLREFYDPFSGKLAEARKGNIKDLFRTEYKCPSCGEGYLLKRPAKGGGDWFACERYPTCKTVADQHPDGSIMLDDSGIPVIWDPNAPKKEEGTTDLEQVPSCPECGEPMKLRKGRYGQFWGCTGYPQCKKTLQLDEGPNQKDAPEREIFPHVKCKECGSPMYKTEGKYGDYLRCTQRDCKAHMNVPIGTCPECDGGWVVKKYSRKKKQHFFSCTNYPECKFATNKLDDINPLPGEHVVTDLI